MLVHIKKIKSYFIIFIILILLCISSLFLVSKIPQSLLTENWKSERIKDFTETSFHYAKDREYGTYVDDYTNNMKMLIAYRLNEQSILSPAGYIEEIDYTYDYGRYWHGYSILLRPLMLIFNMNQIQTVYNIILTLSIIVLLVQLFKRKQFAFIMAFLSAFYLTNMWMCFLDLQHFNCIFIATLACNIILKFPKFTNKYKGQIFFVIGVLVQFFDFLTFETLTLSLPLLCIILISEKKNTIKDYLSIILNTCVSWIFGYGLMFLTKCVSYICVKGVDAIDMLSYKLTERIIGSNVGQEYTIKDVFITNLFCIKGLTFENIPYIVTILMIMIVLYIYFVYGIPDFNASIAMLLTIIIPFMRLVVIREHSATHAPFAYHALFSSIIVIFYIIFFIIFKIIHYYKKR